MYRDQVILQEQECAFLCEEGGMNESEAMLEAPLLLPAVRPSWPLIPWPFHAPHLDSVDSASPWW